jgi:hypothetical protein
MQNCHLYLLHDSSTLSQLHSKQGFAIRNQSLGFPTAPRNRYSRVNTRCLLGRFRHIGVKRRRKRYSGIVATRKREQTRAKRRPRHDGVYDVHNMWIWRIGRPNMDRFRGL